MNIKITLISIALLFPIVFQSFGQNFDTEKYTNEILKHRNEKDQEYRTEDNSPIPDKKKKNFAGLHYFAPDAKYCVEARFEKLTDTTSFIMKTTQVRYQPVYRPYANLFFSIDGKEYQLTAYQNVKLAKQEEYKKYLFIPFNDLTNGMESYGGGRYIDIDIPEGKTVTLDFNKCYNPYCSYNAKYSCPIPPDENNMQIMIPAGEKVWEKH